MLTSKIYRFRLFLNFRRIFYPARRLPPRFLLLNGDKQLKILDVCKTCSDGGSDLQVIQCNASNRHGYAFNNAYVNVLRQYRVICLHLLTYFSS